MTRRDPGLQADERTMLCQFLDYHRATFLQKVDGLDREQLNRRLPPSTLTLAGLTKHLALVEDSWFHEDFLDEPLPDAWAAASFEEDRDWEMTSAAGDPPEQLLALYRAACERSRAIVAATPSLDTLSVRVDRREGIPRSLRWILVHLIEETARHNGHADLLREAIDGAVGE